MINMSVNKGVFPNILKIENIPNHKKGDKPDCNNYRPNNFIGFTS